MPSLVRLADLFQSPQPFSVSGFLYLPFKESWTLETRCAVLPESDIDGIPPFAEENGLEYAIQVAFVHDVIENAMQQLGNPTNEQLLLAFLHYYDRDAFMVFERK